MWTCDRKARLSQLGRSQQEGERPLSNGACRPVRPDDDKRGGSNDLHVTKRRLLFPPEASALRRRGDERAFFNCRSARAQLIGG